MEWIVEAIVESNPWFGQMHGKFFVRSVARTIVAASCISNTNLKVKATVADSLEGNCFTVAGNFASNFQMRAHGFIRDQ